MTETPRSSISEWPKMCKCLLVGQLVCLRGVSLFAKLCLYSLANLANETTNGNRSRANTLLPLGDGW